MNDQIHPSISRLLAVGYGSKNPTAFDDSISAIRQIQEFFNGYAGRKVFVELFTAPDRLDYNIYSWIVGTATDELIRYEDEKIVLPLFSCHTNDSFRSGINISEQGQLILPSTGHSDEQFTDLIFLLCCAEPVVATPTRVTIGCTKGGINIYHFNEEDLNLHLEMVFAKTGKPVPPELLAATP